MGHGTIGSQTAFSWSLEASGSRKRTQLGRIGPVSRAAEEPQLCLAQRKWTDQRLNGLLKSAFSTIGLRSECHVTMIN